MNRQLQYAPAQAPLQAAREGAPVAGELTSVGSVMARGSRAHQPVCSPSATTPGDGVVVKMLGVFRATQVRDYGLRESRRWMKAGVGFRPIVAHRLPSEDRVV
jgi:hypothetical protein